MSRRGGGRRPDTRHDQPSVSAGQSSQQRGGGRGRGRGRGEGGGRGRGTGPGGGRGGRGDYQSPPSAGASSSVSYVSSAVAASSTVPPLGTGTSVASTGASSSGGPAISSDPAVATSVSTAAAALSTELEKKMTLVAPPSSSKAYSVAKRPGFGTVGRKTVVRANHFLVDVAMRELHHYDVSMSPEVTSKKICRDIISELAKRYRISDLGQRSIKYDGSKSIYTAGPLPFESKQFIVKLVDTNPSQSSHSVRKERQFKVTIKFASRPDLHHLLQFIRGRQMDGPQETIQLLDVVLRAAPSEEYTVVGRSFFSPKLGQTGELGDGVEYWRGFYQSLRPTQMGLSLNIDVSARSFYEPIPVIDFVKKHFNFRDISRPLADQDRVKVKKALRGVRVELIHQEYPKKYKITGLTGKPISQLTFCLDDNRTETSVVQYFREKYNIRLELMSLPALQAGSDTKPVYLPMELCRIVGGQRYTKRLNERQVTNLLRATCQRPPQRESSIREIVRQCNYSADSTVRDEFGIQVKDALTVVEARVLAPPRLKYHDTGKEAGVDPRMGQWNMINKKMVNGGTVEFWTCLNFSSRVQRDLPRQFCDQLIAMCISKGMAFNRTPFLPIRSVDARQIERALIDVHKQSEIQFKNMGHEGKQLQMLIIILPDVTGSYGTIKRVCETELGIVSQCCKPAQAAKLNVQYFENVALKINVKVGGRNTVLNDAIQRRIPLVSDRPTIIFGADVTHPQPGEDSSPSIAAVVASMDWPEVTKYRGIVSAQHHRQEIIQDLYKQDINAQRGLVHGGMIREMLMAFYRSTGQKPHRIIFYRDGVSEGQFSQVLLYEMDALRKACASLEEGYLPPVTFVVVQKRHHTRLFAADRNDQDRSGNILPGTVVDTKICHPTEFDFYLNSHAGIQGTSRPTHYHVLYDENRFTADALQILTNNLCYTYARCTRSVSIVPPAYYAHLAAFRARYYMEGDASDSGSASGSGGNVEIRALPNVKDNVKSVMFFC